MADRIASVWRLRAEGVRLFWPGIARRMVDSALQWHHQPDPEWLKRIEGRGTELALRWATSKVLGTPPGPFTVWVRKAGSSSPDRPVTVLPHPLGLLLTWSGEASTLEVQASVADGSRPIVLLGFRGSATPTTAIAAETATGPAGAAVTILLHSAGMTCALLVNGSGPSAVVNHLAEVVQADDWKEWEVVGLPVGDGPDGATLDLPGYDGSKQGLVTALTSPAEAALQRLDRGGPPAGWWPVTEAGRTAPDWSPPDPIPLLEIARGVLPEAAALFTVPGPAQAGLTLSRGLPTPEQDGRPFIGPSSASVGPLGSLMLPATTDPFYALALGYGTGYGLSAQSEVLNAVDFLITADYPDTPEGGPATYAAYIPQPAPHTATAPVTGLAAARDGLIRPSAPDQPWRETIRVSWDAVESSALLGRPTGFALVRFNPGGGPDTECLLDRRTPADWLPRVPSRAPGPAGGPPSSSNVTVDPQQVIPLGSGGHSVGYGVAVQDVIGIWSTWEDTAATTPEPGPPLPRILSARLDAAYTGSALCPAKLAVEVALDWSDRTIATLDLSVALFPAPSTATPPPAGTAPGAVGNTAATVAFTGDVPFGAGSIDVVSLDVSGLVEVVPGPAQSLESRRYALTVPLPSLDYSATRYWAAAVWAHSTPTVLPTGPWTPAAPALAYACSPVPPALPLPPPLPGVPVGSTPDAQGRSHVRVVWGDPAGPIEHFAVYELSETALRQAVGTLPILLPTDPPGAHLAALKDAYDTRLSALQRRALFRRIAQPAAGERLIDVPLPRGSTDIHLFTVLGVGPSSVESAWPQTSDALQAFRAPTVLAPAPPTLRPSFVAVGGSTELRLDVEAFSPLPVTTFRCVRTTSEAASRSAETMGPPFAEVVAVDSGDAPTPTGMRRYTGHWQGPPPTGWRPYRYRAVAVPVPSVPVAAVVGVPSPGSPLVPVSVPPPLPPDLDGLVVENWDDSGIVVRTSTAVPVLVTELGPHVLRGSAGVAGAPVFAELVAGLEALAVEAGSEVAGSPPPPGADPGPLLARGVRTAGRTPLSLWFRRGATTDGVAVTVRLVDPLGRVTTRIVVVPPVPIEVPPSLEILDATVVPGRGVILRLASDASVEVTPEGSALLTIAARRTMVPPFPFPHPFPHEPGPHVPPGPGPHLPPKHLPVSVDLTVPDILVSELVVLPPTPIVAARTSETSPYEYSVLIRLTTPMHVTVRMTAPDGLSATTRTTDLG